MTTSPPLIQTRVFNLLALYGPASTTTISLKLSLPREPVHGALSRLRRSRRVVRQGNLWIAVVNSTRKTSLTFPANPR